jgi:hypothetical protein
MIELLYYGYKDRVKYIVTGPKPVDPRKGATLAGYIRHSGGILLAQRDGAALETGREVRSTEGPPAPYSAR